MAMYRQIAVGIGTMENQRLEKNFQLRLLKYLLFWSLSFFMIQGTYEVNHAVKIFVRRCAIFLRRCTIR